MEDDLPGLISVSEMREGDTLLRLRLERVFGSLTNEEFQALCPSDSEDNDVSLVWRAWRPSVCISLRIDTNEWHYYHNFRYSDADTCVADIVPCSPAQNERVKKALLAARRDRENRVTHMSEPFPNRRETQNYFK